MDGAPCEPYWQGCTEDILSVAAWGTALSPELLAEIDAILATESVLSAAATAGP